MTFRIPQSLAARHQPESGLNVLDYEIAQQKAQALGHLGQQVEQSLVRLRTFREGTQSPDADALSALLDEAADRVWSLMIQRELCGLRHWDQVVKAYSIPREVLNRMGRVK